MIECIYYSTRIFKDSPNMQEIAFQFENKFDVQVHGIIDHVRRYDQNGTLDGG